MDNLDRLNIPLTGVNIVEANAGCGKTSALAGLYLRLILEKALAPKNILVVTYTKAATEELKGRIRLQLSRAIGYAKGGNRDDGEIACLLDNLLKKESANRIHERLLGALRDFDEAAIYTIHGFSRRLLNDFAFESGMLYDFEILDNQDSQLEVVLNDFLRRNLYQAPEEFVNYLLSKKERLKGLKKLLERLGSYPDLKICLPDNPPSDAAVAQALAAFRMTYGRLASAWPEGRERIRGLLSGNALKANIYGQKTDGLLGKIDPVFSGSLCPFPLPPELVKLAWSSIETNSKKGFAKPWHPLFDQVESLLKDAESLEGLFSRKWDVLTGELVQSLPRELFRRNLRRQVLSFDDLLRCVREALNRTPSEPLIREVRTRYRAALIDEFQDTDPLQYEIFQRIFAEGGLVTFYIGDPKQAIFGFRGADVYSYLAALGKTEKQYTLLKNYRSSEGLIQGINTLFVASGDPFVFKEFSYRPSQAGQKDRDTLVLPGFSEAPFQIWHLASPSPPADGTEKEREPGAAQTDSRIALAVACEIKRLIEAGRKKEATLGGRPLLDCDIAVLVRTNSEARLMKEALNRLNIPCVVSGVGSVFATWEAADLSLLIRAIAFPYDERKVRAALATGFFRMSAADLEGLQTDAAARGDWTERFRSYRELMWKYGFLAMFRLLVKREEITPVLLSRKDGKRAMTNLFHLAELLDEEEKRQNHGLSGLARFLDAKISAGGDDPKGDQLRPETDAGGARILTIHKSKGLEFPVVFCPFSWKGVRESIYPVFHDEKDGWRLKCSLGAVLREEDRKRARKEALGEDCRLLYVALTRAKQRLYLVYRTPLRQEISAPSYLIRQILDDSSPPLDARKNAKIPSDRSSSGLKRLAGLSQGTIAISPLPLPVGRPEPLAEAVSGENLTCRTFGGFISNTWQITSFSLLTSQAKGVRQAEEPDYDPLLPAAKGKEITEIDRDKPRPEISREIAIPPGLAGSDELPRGPGVGTLLHEILEEVDFRSIETEETKLKIAERLALHDFPHKMIDPVVKILSRAVNLPLNDRGLKLKTIGPPERLDEMSFYFPLKKITRDYLSGLFRPYLYDMPSLSSLANRLEISPVEGFMRGFMDLVFLFEGKYYLLDWKSNYLGSDREAYSPTSLARQMEASFYVFQYLIYTVALNEYLKQRDKGYRYERDFGGVFYLFLRGMDPKYGNGYGVFFDRPREGFIEALADGLIDRDTIARPGYQR